MHIKRFVYIVDWTSLCVTLSVDQIHALCLEIYYRITVTNHLSAAMIVNVVTFPALCTESNNFSMILLGMPENLSYFWII